ncbi:MAG: hypothetical protein HeimAB125_21970 [Candidatus Heimdallarchaeota archaeon AB_125]|nr:MAG: hypothetical protein HeimAB125_21970 [Candidatus Heimdallarchaeota archaeon AB_125]
MDSIRRKKKDALDDKSPKAKAKRGTSDEIVKVCPVCFFPTKIESSFYIMYHFTCSNENCNWQGPTPIEVDLEDYKEFIDEHLRDSTELESDD